MFFSRFFTSFENDDEKNTAAKDLGRNSLEDDAPMRAGGDEELSSFSLNKVVGEDIILPFV